MNDKPLNHDKRKNQRGHRPNLDRQLASISDRTPMQTIIHMLNTWAVIHGPVVSTDWTSLDWHRARQFVPTFWWDLTPEEVGQINGGN